MVVNHNMAAICESRQLRYNVKKMEKSSKKLATGYKLNTANDDAAGLQISETMRHHVKGLNKASRNSQDGISMLQTADAALQETQDVLDRMVELTTQAANDINTDSDRRAIQDELDQLNKEWTVSPIRRTSISSICWQRERRRRHRDITAYSPEH